MEIKITIQQLECLLREQRDLTIQQCMKNTYYYNAESTESHSNSLNIDKQKFIENGEQSPFPNDFNVLKKYNS